MTNQKSDRDVYPPVDDGSFLPSPEFFSAIYRLSSDHDLAVRYYAAEQSISLLIASIPASEAAVNAVELVSHILTNRQMRAGVQQFVIGRDPAAEEGEEWNRFGDDGETAALILEVVSLPGVMDRAAALSSLAIHAVEDIEVPEPHLGHIRRFLLRSRNERTIRQIS